MTTTNSKKTKLEFSSQCQTLANGVLALPDKTLTVSEQSLTTKQCAAPLLAYVAAATQTATALSAYRKAVQAEKAAEADARSMYDQLKPVLVGRLGKTNPALETTYGIPPAKVPQTSVAAKAGGVQKSLATRKANHTMGPKQKKAAKQAAEAAPAPTPVVPAPTK
jgi:hypothetical protein